MVEDTTTATSNVFSWIRDALFNRHHLPTREPPAGTDRRDDIQDTTDYRTGDFNSGLGELDDVGNSRRVFFSQDDTNYERGSSRQDPVDGFGKERSLFRTNSLGELNETFYRKYELLHGDEEDDDSDLENVGTEQGLLGRNNGYCDRDKRGPRNGGADKELSDLRHIFKVSDPSSVERQHIETKQPQNDGDTGSGNSNKNTNRKGVKGSGRIHEIPGHFIPVQLGKDNTTTTNTNNNDNNAMPSATTNGAKIDRPIESFDLGDENNDSNNNSATIAGFQAALTQLYKNTTELKLIQDDFNRRDLESRNREAYYKQRYELLKGEYITSLRGSKKILDQIIELTSLNRSLKKQLDTEKSRNLAKIRELERSHNEEISALHAQLDAVQAGYKELEARYNVLRIRLEFSESTNKYNRSRHYPPPPDS